MKTDTPLQNHLGAVMACLEAREWAGDRTAQQAWRETTRPDWLIWWRLRVHKTDRAAVLLVIVPLLREHTLPLCREQDKSACYKALDAAEEWAKRPNKRSAAAAAAAAYWSAAVYWSAAAATVYWSAAAAAAYWSAAAADDAAAAAAAARRRRRRRRRRLLVRQRRRRRLWSAAAVAAALRIQGGSARHSAQSDARAKLNAIWCSAIRQRWPDAPFLERSKPKRSL